MPKFNRAVRVDFLSSAADPVGDVIEPITDLRVSFDVDKADGIQMNHATLVIYNMSPNDRAAISRPMPLRFDLRYALVDPVVTVRIFAGYEQDTVRHLYTGDLLFAHTNRVGPDWVTQIELYTGLSQATRPIQVSFRTPTPAREILEAIVRPLALTLRYTPDAAITLEGKLVQDYSVSGIAYREAEIFLRNRFGLSFTIEDEGQGLVYVPTKARAPNEAKSDANTFAPRTGLIGTPRITRTGIELRSLLRPDFALFQRFFVDSETTRGTLQSPDYTPEYFAAQVKHAGDNRGDEWFTDIVGFYANLDSR